MTTHDYVECRESDIPTGVRFDVPGRNQGQIIEVAYGGYGAYEHGKGDPYMRITDHSDRSVAYYVALSSVRPISLSRLRQTAIGLLGTVPEWAVYRDGSVVRPVMTDDGIVPLVQPGELIRWRGQGWRVVAAQEVR